MTCWHCVKEQPPAGDFYAVRDSSENGNFRVHPLLSIEQDKEGRDIATAHCQAPDAACMSLTDTPPLVGADVYTFGYPFPRVATDTSGFPTFEITGRLLKSYIARNFFYDHPELGRVDAYELGTSAPKGFSGSPLALERTKEVVGIIFGSHDVDTIEEFATVDPDTGRRDPEVRRISSFALAYDFDELSEVATAATGGKPLGEFLHTESGDLPTQ
jgi:hypothetical protein